MQGGTPMNKPHQEQLGVQVYAAGYAYHQKPYYGKNEPRSSFLLRIQTEGLSRTWIDGEFKLVEAGDVLIVPPDAFYELKIDVEDHRGERKIESGDYFIFFDGDWAADWWQQRTRPFKLKVPLEEGFLQLCRLTVVEHRRDSAESKRMTDYLMRVILMTIDRIITEHRPQKGNAFLAYRIKNYVEENAANNFQLQDIADYFNISVSRAVHLYKEMFGKSIMQHALDVRLELARERIIYTSMPLELIAEMSGFSSYTYFYRTFKRKFGLAPKEYRMQNRLL